MGNKEILKSSAKVMGPIIIALAIIVNRYLTGHDLIIGFLYGLGIATSIGGIYWNGRECRKSRKG